MPEARARRRRAGAVVLAAGLATGVVGLAYGVLRGGLSTRVEPLPGEAWLARRARHLAIPGPERARSNPVPPTAEAIAAGRAHFADHCATCHANDGRGQTPLGQGLYPKPPDMTGPETQSLSDGELFWVIRNGVRFTGMPAFGSAPAEADEETWRLVRFIRRLPGLSEAEVSEMKALNPLSRHELEQEQEAERFLAGGSALGEDPVGGSPERRRER